MGYIWSEKIDPILMIGRSLQDIGVHNWGLTRDDALIALERLRAIGVAIAGGDVYLLSGTRVDVSYDNWYCDKSAEESEAQFLIRSINKAVDYISNYRAVNAIFAIVPMV